MRFRQFFNKATPTLKRARVALVNGLNVLRSKAQHLRSVSRQTIIMILGVIIVLTLWITKDKPSTPTASLPSYIGPITLAVVIFLFFVAYRNRGKVSETISNIWGRKKDGAEESKDKKLKDFFVKMSIALAAIIGIHFIGYLWVGDEFVTLMNTNWWWKLIVTIFLIGIAVQYGDVGKKVAWAIAGLALVSIFFGRQTFNKGSFEKTIGSPPSVVTDIQSLSDRRKAIRHFVSEGFYKAIIVCDCETGLRQFEPNGEVVAHQNTDKNGKPTTEDVGICSINTTHQRNIIRAINEDPFTLNGNLKLTTHILRSATGDPYAPWNYTRDCWQKRWEDALELPITAPADGSYGHKINLRKAMIAHGFSKGTYLWFWKDHFETKELVTIEINGHEIPAVTDSQIELGLQDTLRVRTDSGKEVTKWFIVYQRP